MRHPLSFLCEQLKVCEEFGNIYYNSFQHFFQKGILHMSKSLKSVFAWGRVPGLLIVYVVLQPLLDALTSVCAEAEWALTPGAVVRALFVAAAALWLLFSGNYTGRRRVLVYLGLITGYLTMFCIWSLQKGGLSLCIENASEALKVFYTLYTALLLYALYLQRGFLLPLWSIALSGAGYCLIILLAYVTGTSFVSYNAGYGYCGWFYSANDISNVILLSAPVLLHLCFTELVRGREKRWYLLAAMGIVMFSVVFSAAFLGTKLVYLGVALYLAAALCWFVVRLAVTREKALLRGLIIALLLAALLGGLYPVSPLNAYVNDIFVPMSGEDEAAMEAALSTPGVKEADRARKNAELEAAAKGTWLGDLVDTNPIAEKLNWLLSRRLLYIAPILEEYLDGGIWVKLMGLGYGQTADYRKDIGQLVEMEAVMLLLRHGIVGLLLCYVPCLAAAGCVIVGFFRKLKQHMASLTYCSLLYSAMIALAASLIVGHVVQAPSVCIFAAAVYAQLLCVSSEKPADGVDLVQWKKL